MKAEAEVLRKSKNEKLKLQSELKDRDLELIALNAKVLVVQKLESEIQVLQNELSLLRNKYSDQEQKVAHVEKLEEECQELKQNIIELQLQAVVVPKLKAEIKILQEKSSCIQDVVKESEETYRKEFLTEEIVKLKEELKSLQEDSIKKEQRFLNDINSMKQREKDLLMKLQVIIIKLFVEILFLIFVTYLQYYFEIYLKANKIIKRHQLSLILN